MAAKDNIQLIPITKEMRQSYLDYAMSVIVSRALPDVRDGLKPVQRRILFSMGENSLYYNKPFHKSASTVGNVIANYHPHGDGAVYDAMVRMVQKFSMSLPLIDGQGNFGSMDGDRAAAYRYTESRLARSAHFLLADIDKETVAFNPNFDGTKQEPSILPAQFPNILVNGAGGIAVGMATNIPPHNIREVIDACIAYIDNPDITVIELLEYVKGPDFPTGGIIIGSKGILDAYSSGRGSIAMRAKTHFEEVKGNKQAIIITEIPYQVNKARMVEKIAECVKNKVIEGIADLRDESSLKGVRVIIELKRDVDENVVLNLLYKHTPVQSFFGANMIALNEGKPQMMNLYKFISRFISFRREVLINRSKYELKQDRKKAHMLLGLSVAIANIDQVIELIKNAKNPPEAKEQLMAKRWTLTDSSSLFAILERSDIELIDERDGVWEQGAYSLTGVQATAILEMRLHRLTGLERDKVVEDLKELLVNIKELLNILSSPDKLYGVMQEELLAVKEMFGVSRRTEIVEGNIDADIESFIQKEDMAITISHQGYIKRVPLSMYRAQKRGGKGKTGMKTKDEDFVKQLFVADTHTPILFFGENGLAYQLKTYKLPLGSLTSKGKPVVNLLPIEHGDTMSSVLPLTAHEDMNISEMYMIFVTSHGNVRRNKLEDFLNIRSNGKIAMKLEGDEKLVAVAPCQESDSLLIATKHGLCIRFMVGQVRCFSSRASSGVKGIKLKSGDEVVSMSVLEGGKFDSAIRDSYLKVANFIRRHDGFQERVGGFNNFEDIDAKLWDIISKEFEETTGYAIWSDIDKDTFMQLADTEQAILTITSRGMGKRSSSYDYRLTRRAGVGIANIELGEKSGQVVSSFPVNPEDQIMLVTNGGQLIRCAVKDVRVVGRRSQGVMVFRLPDDEKVAAVSHVAENEDDELDTEVGSNIKLTDISETREEDIC